MSVQPTPWHLAQWTERHAPSWVRPAIVRPDAHALKLSELDRLINARVGLVNKKRDVDITGAIALFRSVARNVRNGVYPSVASYAREFLSQDSRMSGHTAQRARFARRILKASQRKGA